MSRDRDNKRQRNRSKPPRDIEAAARRLTDRLAELIGSQPTDRHAHNEAKRDDK